MHKHFSILLESLKKEKKGVEIKKKLKEKITIIKIRKLNTKIEVEG